METPGTITLRGRKCPHLPHRTQFMGLSSTRSRAGPRRLTPTTPTFSSLAPLLVPPILGTGMRPALATSSARWLTALPKRLSLPKVTAIAPATAAPPRSGRNRITNRVRAISTAVGLVRMVMEAQFHTRNSSPPRRSAILTQAQPVVASRVTPALESSLVWVMAASDSSIKASALRPGLLLFSRMMVGFSGATGNS